jgi:hypothetical protein
MQDELLNAAILLRRGSWVDPELFERAAKRMAELEAAVASEWHDADSYFDKSRHLESRVAELEATGRVLSAAVSVHNEMHNRISDFWHHTHSRNEFLAIWDRKLSEAIAESAK